MRPKRPQISIIVPVYNAEATLYRCIDSILNQTFMDWELLLIDDGSRDESGRICDQYAQIDSRIRAFHKPNAGVSSARNVGLDHAIGEWIAFADSDDYTNSRWLETFAIHFDKGYSLIIQNAEEEWNNGNVSTLMHLNRGEMSLKDFLMPTYEGIKCFNGYLWHKCFRNEIIKGNKVRFNVRVRVLEDEIFIFKYCKSQINSKIFIENYSGYHYFNPSQNFSTKYGETIEEEKEVFETVKSCSLPLAYCIDRFIIGAYGSFSAEPENFESKISQLRSIIGKNINKVSGKRKYLLSLLSYTNNDKIWTFIFKFYFNITSKH
ncbi:MAG: glycosyltransferase family 2 protein [Bacteroidales bacterium]|nr:glycosyltransferase family 2 protein [Bacteroidales bacterium]